jgi:hypothetical protein
MQDLNYNHVLLKTKVYSLSLTKLSKDRKI